MAATINNKSIPATRYNFALVFFVALGSFTYGFNASIMGTVFGLAPFFSYFNLDLTCPGADYANSMIGATNGLFSAGGIIGCLLMTKLADKFGRKRTIQAICVVCVVSAIFQAAAVHIAMLLVGRFLNGLGSGMTNVIIPLYQSEVAPPHIRGRMVGAHAAAPGILDLGSSLIPESPRWLVTQDRGTEALDVLTKLHHQPGDSNNEAAQSECRAIKAQLMAESSEPKSFVGIMRKPSYRKRILIGIFVQCIAQSTGVLVINNYQVLLYNGLGLTGYLPLLLYGVYTAWAAFLNWVGAMFVDKFGRILMLTVGLVGCALMVAVEAAIVAVVAENKNNHAINAAGVFFLFVFVTFYATCIDAISYIYCTEIFPTSIRAKGVSYSVIGLFIMTLIYTHPAPIAFAQVGWKYYLVFVIVPLLGAPVVYFMFPETKGLSLEEIGTLFDDGNETSTVEVREDVAEKLDCF
ncbi:sugar transporter [Fusarium phyllophilum]|uniref:Sugar transporter n=1 Tax=Fusarium phyllophilum TaxID=47803 RepID=A0A8H5N977_9HYPO|nr:sugar transporter [Fusarium phyllophilum]